MDIVGYQPCIVSSSDTPSQDRTIVTSTNSSIGIASTILNSHMKTYDLAIQCYDMCDGNSTYEVSINFLPDWRLDEQ